MDSLTGNSISPLLLYRIYQGYSLYLLARNCALVDCLKDEPDASPLDKDSLQLHCAWTTSKILDRIVSPPPKQVEPLPSPEQLLLDSDG